MAIMSFHPNNALESIKNLLDLSSELWYVAGDTSVDVCLELNGLGPHDWLKFSLFIKFNWYTKRMTLAVIYKSTELYMIQDKSDNFADTWKFLDRRFEDLRSFGSVKKSLSDCNQLVCGSLRVVSGTV